LLYRAHYTYAPLELPGSGLAIDANTALLRRMEGQLPQ
jgi:hypothetical protein